MAEMLKYGEEKLVRKLETFLVKIWQEELPKEWSEAIITISNI